MDPPIEDIAAKWVSLVIFHMIQRAQERFERSQIKYQLELLCMESGVKFSSLDFSSWSIGSDFLEPSELRFRRCATYFSVQRDTEKNELLHYCLSTICDLSNMMEKYQIAARLRNRRLIDLIVVSSNFSIVKSMLFVSALACIEKLLESNTLHPSDLADPYSQIRDLVYNFTILSSTNNTYT